MMPRGGCKVSDTILFQGKEIDLGDEQHDEIHKPDHYTWKGKECKEIIDAMTTGLTGIEAYYMGNIIKYLYRCQKKGTPNNDLLKAEEYTELLRKLYWTE
nr:MAG TPA: nucelotide kinase [Caudoviricetes sp.]